MVLWDDIMVRRLTLEVPRIGNDGGWCHRMPRDDIMGCHVTISWDVMVCRPHA
jgi:hypothetical protein